MKRPLYCTASQDPTNCGREGHAGLWFDKFCNEWRVDNDNGLWTMSSSKKQDNPKLKWLRRVTKKQIGTEGQINEYVNRLKSLVESRRGRVAEFKAESRFVTGLGRSHPVENGFAWHPTLGTPFLPGSSVKGMVRSWANLDAEPRPNEQCLQRLLGKFGSSGAVCFPDAVPVARVQLEADVMTPHYAGWTKDDPPGDWRSPTPIPFLVTAAETRFLFGIIPRHRAVSKQDFDTVWSWLCDALEYEGGGAKTAVGYGRFVK